MTNQILAAFLGECWHEVPNYEIVPWGYCCVKCHKSARDCKNPDFSTIHSADGKRFIDKLSSDLALECEFDEYCIEVWSRVDEIKEPYGIWFTKNCMELFADFLKWCFAEGKHGEWFWKECKICHATGWINPVPDFVTRVCPACAGTGRILIDLGRLMGEGK